MLLNVNGALRLIYDVGNLVHFIIKYFTIKYLCILRLEFTILMDFICIIVFYMIYYFYIKVYNVS